MLGFINGSLPDLVHWAGLLVSLQVRFALGWRDANGETALGNYIKGAQFFLPARGMLDVGSRS